VRGTTRLHLPLFNLQYFHSCNRRMESTKLSISKSVIKGKQSFLHYRLIPSKHQCTLLLLHLCLQRFAFSDPKRTTFSVNLASGDPIRSANTSGFRIAFHSTSIICEKSCQSSLSHVLLFGNANSRNAGYLIWPHRAAAVTLTLVRFSRASMLKVHRSSS